MVRTISKIFQIDIIWCDSVMGSRIIRRFVIVGVLALVPIFAYANLIFTALVVFGAAVVVSSFAQAVGVLLSLPVLNNTKKILEKRSILFPNLEN